MLSDLAFRIRSLLRYRAAEAELDDELRFHAEQQRDKYVKSGMTREEAARLVRMEFGGIDQVKEDCREARGVQFMETLMKDVLYALRTLRKTPGFTCVALLTLGLGIGVNTAIFSVVDAVLLRPLPFTDAARLIALNETTPRVGRVSVSYLDFRTGARRAARFQIWRPWVASDSTSLESINRRASAARPCRRISFRCWGCGPSWDEISMHPRAKPVRHEWCC